MQQFFKRIALVVTLLAIGLVVGACGGGTSDADDALVTSGTDSTSGEGMPDWATGVIAGEIDGEAFRQPR